MCTHAHTYVMYKMCVCASATLKRPWDKAQRSLGELTSGQPQAAGSWDLTLIIIEK